MCRKDTTFLIINNLNYEKNIINARYRCIENMLLQNYVKTKKSHKSITLTTFLTGRMRYVSTFYFLMLNINPKTTPKNAANNT